MSIMSKCPACTSALRVPEGLGDRKARCPKCGEIFYPGRQASSPNSESVGTIAPDPQLAPLQQSQLEDEVVSDDFDVVDDDVPSDNFEVIDDDPVQSAQPRDEAPKKRKRLLADDDESARALLGPSKKRAKDEDGESQRDRPRKKSTSNKDEDGEPQRDRPRKKSASNSDDSETKPDRPRKKSASNNDDDSETETDRPRKKKGKKSRQQQGKFNYTTLAIGAGVIITIGMITGMVFAVRSLFDDEISAERWKTHEVPERYKVQIPGTPQLKSQTVGPMTFIQNTYDYDFDTAFAVMHSEGVLPRDRAALPADRLLNDACDGFIAEIDRQGQGPVEIKRESINLGPYPGKLLVVNVKKRKVNAVGRLFMVGQRLYVVMAVGKKYDEDNVNVKKFLNSFELLESPPPMDKK